jgi:hypothetical protein
MLDTREKAEIGQKTMQASEQRLEEGRLGESVGLGRRDPEVGGAELARSESDTSQLRPNQPLATGWAGPRWRRDALRRRLLALADVLAVLITTVIVLPSQSALFWSATFLPAWVLLAKATGNYERDHRSIRHRTIDELVSLFAWAALGSLILSEYMSITPAGELSASVTMRIFYGVGVGAVILRALVRGVGRALSAPPRA